MGCAWMDTGIYVSFLGRSGEKRSKADMELGEWKVLRRRRLRNVEKMAFSVTGFRGGVERFSGRVSFHVGSDRVFLKGYDGDGEDIV